MNHSKQLKVELSLLEFPKPVTIYADGEMPTANNPENFISITNNGVARTSGSQYGLIDQILAVAIYVKLSTTGAKNSALEEAIYEKIFEKFKFTKSSGSYTFQIARNNMFGNYKNLTAGYSTRIINFETTFINN